MSEEHLIWAFGLTRPSSASPDADLEMHFAADTLVFDLTKELDADGNHLTAAPKPVATTKVAPTPVPTMRIEPPVPTHTSHEHVTPFSVHEKLIVLHAGFLVMGFLVLLPFGSLVARWTRTFTTHWFKAHKLSNYYVSAAFIVLGWSLGPIAIFKVDAAHLNDSHKVLYLDPHSAIYILLTVFIPDRRRVPVCVVPIPAVPGPVHPRPQVTSQEMAAPSFKHFSRCRGPGYHWPGFPASTKWIVGVETCHRTSGYIPRIPDISEDMGYCTF